MEREDEVGARKGEDELGFGGRRRRRRRVAFGEGVGLTGDDGLWDLPSLARGVCNSDSQPVFGFKAGDEVEILDVRSKNGRALDEAKISGQQIAGGINGGFSNCVPMPN